ncbi:uncharacterized protein [Amphiura filiformis]|uniref:uncharacterized protein n=1 Tax=Amphiura filiformis TaxID=82378 RepID=UPI003B20EFF7
MIGTYLNTSCIARHHYVWLLISLFILVWETNGGVNGQHTVSVTANTNPTKKGLEQRLTCSYANLNGKEVNSISWSKGPNFTGSSQIATYRITQSGGEITYNDSYGNPGDYVMSMPAGNSNQGSTSLTITAIAVDDIGVFWCNVNAEGFPVQGHIAIDVLVTPTSTSLSLPSKNPNTGDSIEVLEATSYAFNCSSIGVRPAASFIWRLENIEQNPDNQINSPNSEDERLTDCVSVLIVQPLFSENHNDKVECDAYIPEDPSDLASTHVFLDVKVPPTNDKIFISDSLGRHNEGSNVRINQGQSHTFTCEVEQTRPAANFDWEPMNDDFVIGLPIAPTAGNSLVDSSQTLTIPQPNDSHHGINLKCKTNIDTSESLQPVIRSILIQVYGPPEEPTLTGNVNDMTEGISERLECKALNGFPTGDLNWYINDQEITDKDVFNKPSTSSRYDIISNITFNPTKDHNGGRLKCDVLHETLQPGEERSVVQTIYVKYSPRNVFINQSPPNPVVENTPVTLRCTADANPVPDHFVWLKGEAEVGNDGNVLQFANINRNDEGQYKCKATNGIGNEGVSPVAMVTVHYPPENVILTKSIEDPVQEGERLVLTCTSGGKPSPNTFYWFQNDMPLPNTNSNQLILESINKEQASVYKCEAENGVPENVQSNEVDVIVYYSPEITTEKTIHSIDEGKDASLECIGIGHPEPTLKWYTSEGIPINSGGKSISPNDVRIVTGESKTTTLTVRWTRGHNGGVNQWFIIKYYKDEENEEELYSGTVKETSDVDYKYQINGLTSGIAYYIRVISGNIIGNNTSQESPRARGITLPVSPKELGVTMEYVQKAQTLSVGNLPEYSDESHCLQLQLHQGDMIWYNWTCIFENQDKLNVPDGVVEVQATYCVESVCGDASKATSDSPPTDFPKPSNIGAIIGSTMGVIIVILFAIIVALAYLLRKQRNGRSQGKSIDHELDTGSTKFHLTDTEIASSIENKAHSAVNSGFVETDLDLNDRVKEPYVNYLLKQFIFPRENLHIQNELGHGEFGRVLLGMATGIVSGERETKVAVKTLKHNANDEAKQQLVKEFNQMKSLMPALVKQKNRNVIRLLGGCMGEDPLYVILEYMKNGNLKTLLRESRTIGDGTYGNLFAGSKSFTPTQLMGFAHQVANGMAFLSRQRCIHRDLAARNVLLNESFECKVSDFGLAEDVMNGEVYRRQNEGRLPIRWMAIESVLGDVHTTESDVWSFGVLLWEIVTLGSRPYPKLKGDDIRKLLKNGQRMPRPKHCSEQLYNIMLACWEKEPSQRPSFEQLMKLLDEILEGQNGYLSLADFETKLYEDVSLPAPNEKV